MVNPEATAISGELAKVMEANDVVDPGVGLHEEIEFADYLKIEAANNTELGWLEESPAHLHYYRKNPPTFVDPNDVGTALHALLLEGEEAFRSRYARGKGDNRSRSWWKQRPKDPETGCWLDDDGRILLRPTKDWDAVFAMADNVYAHPWSATILGLMTATEVTGVWVDGRTGVKCKLRADGICPSIETVVDLKHTSRIGGAGEEQFSRTVDRYGYHRQAAFYREGLHAITGIPYSDHVWIVVECEPPYMVAVYRPIDADVLLGHDEIWGIPGDEEDRPGLLRRYGRIVNSEDVFPGYSEDVEDLSLHRYAVQRREARLYRNPK